MPFMECSTIKIHARSAASHAFGMQSMPGDNHSKDRTPCLLMARIALSIRAATNIAAQLATGKFTELSNFEVPKTRIPTPGGEARWRRLGVNLAIEPNFSTLNLFTH